jgi:hypothetical protein
VLLFRDPIARVIWIVVLLLRIAFFAEVRMANLDITKNPQLDAIFLHDNAKAIAEGDIRLVHPLLGNYSAIRDKIYGPERYDRLFKPETYTDSPGYLYFAALCEFFGRGSPYAVVFVQLLLDALGCALG